MSEINTVCVYCGSGPGADPDFVIAARELGRLLAENRIGLVYGGGSIGLIGALGHSVLDHCGGGVRGVPAGSPPRPPAAPPAPPERAVPAHSRAQHPEV